MDTHQCSHESTIKMIDERLVRMEIKLDELKEYKANQQGMIKALSAVWILVGGILTLAWEKLLK